MARGGEQGFCDQLGCSGHKHNPVDPNEMESRDDIRSVAFSTRSDSTAPLTKLGTVRESRLCCKGRDGDMGWLVRLTDCS